MATHPTMSSSESEEPEFNFQEAFEETKDVPCRVHDVTVEGNKRTKSHVIARELERLRGATTLDELKDELLVASANLRALSIFRNIDIVADAGPDDLEGTADIAVTLEEKGVWGLSTGTYLQGNEGSVEASVRAQNLFGTAEVMQGNASLGSQSSNVYSWSYTQPRVAGTYTEGEWRLFQNTRCLQKHSSHTELNRGTKVVFSQGRHELSYELAWRRLYDPSQLASREVRKMLGDGVKSSVGYKWEVDARDNAWRPTRGALLRWSTEVAGVGLDPMLTRFLKNVVQAQVAIPIAEGVDITLDAKAGLLLPWGSAAGTNVADRFYMGGPSSVRGFRTRSVGPADERRVRKDDQGEAGSLKYDYLGGDVMCTAKAAVNFDIPQKVARALGVHGHVFANAGNLAPLNAGAFGSWGGFESALADFVSTFRCSVGAGVVFPTRIGRLEINYCHVLSAEPTDRTKRGVQVGFSTIDL
mmetsp:Transcript_54263/g.172255  ORF Transcript_54263/g.172255 Transcript_54263/m.172255 type:complete len:471 (+) Transcript_54263:310-1722(+)